MPGNVATFYQTHIAKRPRLFLLALLVWLPAMASGQEMLPPTPPREATRIEGAISLDEIEQSALINNPTIGQAMQEVRRREGIALQAGLRPNPTVGVGAQEIGNGGAAGMFGAWWSQPIVTANKLSLAQHEALAGVEIAWRQYSAQQLRVLSDVRRLYFETLAAQQTLQTAQQLVAVSKDAVTAAQSRFQAKLGEEADVLQAKAQVGTAQLRVIQASNDRQRAWRQMWAAAGQRAPALAILQQDTPSETPLQWEETRDRILSQSPELAVARWKIEQAKRRVNAEIARGVPNRAIQTGVGYDEGAGTLFGSVQFQTALPIYNRNQGNVLRARAELTSACKEAPRVELELNSRIAEAFRRYEAARQQLRIYDEQILPNAEKAREQTLVGYRGGIFDYVTMLTAQQNNLQARLNAIVARRELNLAETSLRGLLLNNGLGAR